MQPLAQFQALVVGVGSYTYYSDLPETVNDATSLAGVLVDPQRCGYPKTRVRLLQEREATVGNILAGLETLAREAASDTTTLVYFSGHGGYAASDPDTIYLCPSEADPRNLDSTAISNAVFSQALADIKTQRLVVILDACHASGAASFKDAVKAPPWIGEIGQHFAQYKLRQGAGRVIFASSQREQPSWTYPTGHMSLFTYYLIEGLKGQGMASNDGLIRVFDLFQYVSTQVRGKKRSQEPVLAAQDVTMNFPIALYQGGRKGETAPAAETDTVSQIRGQIVGNARSGINALWEYLKSLPVEILEAAGIDMAAVELKLAEFNELEKRIRIMGDHPAWQATRAEIIYYFISLCIELQRADQQ